MKQENEDLFVEESVKEISKKFDAFRKPMEKYVGEIGNVFLSGAAAYKLAQLGVKVNETAVNFGNESVAQSDKLGEALGWGGAVAGVGLAGVGLAAGAYTAHCVCKYAKSHDLKNKFLKACEKAKDTKLSKKVEKFVSKAKDSVVLSDNDTMHKGAYHHTVKDGKTKVNPIKQFLYGANSPFKTKNR